MVNGNSGLIGIASDMIGSVKEQFIGTESMLGDINALGMTRPLAQFNIAAQLKEQGGILPSLQTGIKRQAAARKGGNTGNPAPRRYYREPTDQQPRTPSPPAPNGDAQPARTEIIL